MPECYSLDAITEKTTIIAMERKVGEVFEHDGIKVKTLESDRGCLFCFYHGSNSKICNIKCLRSLREDKTDVIFIAYAVENKSEKTTLIRG